MTGRVASDDPQVVAALADSVVVRAAGAVNRSVWSAAAGSRAATVALDAWCAWHGWSRADRRFASGVAAIAAAITVTVLASIAEWAPGWMWVVPPASAFVVGLLLVWSSREGGRDSAA